MYALNAFLPAYNRGGEAEYFKKPHNSGGFVE